MYVNTNIPNAEKARELQDRARAAIDQVRTNDTLSAVGRRQQIEAIYEDVTTKLDSLRGQHQSGQGQRKSQLETSLFGRLTAPTGADVINYRDADDRASRLESEAEAVELIVRATQVQDRVLRNAVARKAVAERWVAPLEEWAEGSQRLEDQLTELLAINSTLGDVLHGSASIAAGLASDLVFQFPRPRELDTSEGWAEIRDNSEPLLYAAYSRVGSTVEFAPPQTEGEEGGE